MQRRGQVINCLELTNFVLGGGGGGGGGGSGIDFVHENEEFCQVNNVIQEPILFITNKRGTCK